MTVLNLCLFCNKSRNDPNNVSTVCLGMRMTHGLGIGAPKTAVPTMVHPNPPFIIACRQFPHDSGIPEAAREADPELVASVEKLLQEAGTALATGMALAFSKEGDEQK